MARVHRVGQGDVRAALFDESFDKIASPFGFVLHDLSAKPGPKWRLDYSRPEGISDDDYMRRIFKQAIAEEVSGKLHWGDR